MLAIGLAVGIGAVIYLRYLVPVQNNLPTVDIRVHRGKLLVESWRKRNFFTPIHLHFEQVDLNLFTPNSATEYWLISSEFRHEPHRYVMTVYVDPQAGDYLALDTGALTPLANALIRSKLFRDETWFQEFVTVGGL